MCVYVPSQCWPSATDFYLGSVMSSVDFKHLFMHDIYTHTLSTFCEVTTYYVHNMHYYGRC